ncbi:MAG: YbaK/EbsC family protein [Thermoprotei archaeon]
MNGTERVRNYIQMRSIQAEIRILESSTRSSQLAAKALGCSVAEIAKSIVFVDEQNTLVVVLSGDKKVDLQKLCGTLGLNLRLATPEEVFSRTGYMVGGVPPFPHRSGVRVVVDSSVLRFPIVWAAAGDNNSLMQISTAELVRASEAQVIEASN